MADFDKEYKRLNAKQRQAVDYIDGPLLVIAGPGTGKTQLLSARVAQILRQTDTLPQSILCLTFTEAASLNMRERLSGMIGEAAYDVHISTYHSFASDIIRTYPEFFETVDLETGEDSRMERPIDELRQFEIIKDIIGKLPFSDPLRNARYYVKSVVSAISDFKQAAMTPEQVKAVAESNATACRELSESINNIMTSIPRKLPVALELFGRVAEIVGGSASELAEACAKELETAIASAEADNSTKPLTAWKNLWLHKDENDRWSFTDPAQAQKLLSLSRIYASYQTELTKSGQYDFNDMIIRTIDAMEHQPELKFNLQEKYQYILLDEFQDTNAAQFKLVKQLADHPVHEGRPNIMAVGDDDQGIFAFQGADIGNMVAFKDGFRGVEVISLEDNYRSHSDILHVAHNIASQIESRLHHSLEDVTKDIRAAADSLPQKATIARHEFASQAAECGWIADRVAGLIKDGVPAGEIAVLAPKHVILECLVPFLNARHIPVAYEKRENIFDTPIIQALLLICDFLQSAAARNIRRMDELLPKVLSLDFWEVPTTDIWKINWDFHAAQFKEPKTWPEMALATDSTRQATEFLLRLGTMADTTPLEYILDYITGASELTLDDGQVYVSPMKTFYFGSAAQDSSPMAFYETISHLSVIRSHLRDQQAQTEDRLTVRHFLNIYETYREAEQPLLNTHPIAQSDSAVQLQTVFKAKGLEYEYVFLPSMQDDVWGSSATSGGPKISLPENLKHIRHDSSSEDTKRRILFVAITRARHGLYCTSYAQKENGKKTLPVKYLQETVTDDGRISAVLPEASRQVNFAGRPAEQVRDDVDTLWHSRHLTLIPDLKSLLAERLKRYVMSPTHLNGFTNLEYSGPQAFLLNTLLRFPAALTPDSIYGDALHRSLEWFQKQGGDGSWPATEQVLGYFVARMERSQLTDADRQDYTQRGTRALKTYLSANMDRLKSSPGLAEVDFRNEGVTLEEAILTGKIDRLEIDRSAKTVRIIDFKSGDASLKWGSQSKYINYKQQLYFYILLIEKSYTYKDYKVESACLEFIEPLPDGQAAPPLVLDFDQSEYNAHKDLVKAVWRRIQTLDLPDTSGYPQTPSGTRAFISNLLES